MRDSQWMRFTPERDDFLEYLFSYISNKYSKYVQKFGLIQVLAEIFEQTVGILYNKYYTRNLYALPNQG